MCLALSSRHSSWETSREPSRHATHASGHSSGEAAGHTTHASWHPSFLPWCTPCGLIYPHHDGIINRFDLLLFGLVFLGGGLVMLVKPFLGWGEQWVDLARVLFGELAFELLVNQRILDGINIVLQPILGIHLLANDVIFSFELLCLFNQSLDVVLAQSALIIRDGNLFSLACGLVRCRHVHDAILVYIEGDLNLRHTSRGRGYTIQVELPQAVVVLRHLPFSFIHLYHDSRLIVGVGCEDLRFLGGHCCVSRNQHGHDLARSLYAHW